MIKLIKYPMGTSPYYLLLLFRFVKKLREKPYEKK